MPERPRLTNLRPRLNAAPLRVQTQDMTTEAGRTEAAPWRSWYTTRRWRRLRWECLSRDEFTCQRCGRLEGDTSKLVADHKAPHRGDPDLFWGLHRLQTLCAPCHSGAKQREERRAGPRGAV